MVDLIKTFFNGIAVLMILKNKQFFAPLNLEFRSTIWVQKRIKIKTQIKETAKKNKDQGQDPDSRERDYVWSSNFLASACFLVFLHPYLHRGQAVVPPVHRGVGCYFDTRKG